MLVLNFVIRAPFSTPCNLQLIMSHHPDTATEKKKKGKVSVMLLLVLTLPQLSLPVILNHCSFKQGAAFFFSLSRADAACNFDKLPVTIHCIRKKKENEKIVCCVNLQW